MASINDVLSGLLDGGSSVASKADVRKIAQPALEMIQSNGGLQHMLEQMQHSIIANQVSSWISQGPNQPATPDQVAEAVGEENVEEIAAETGLSVDQVKTALSEFLPGLVSKLTPSGQIPSTQQITDILKQVPGAGQMQSQVNDLIGRLTGR
jgi:uncharacterized protein YidB (DUF937 family)